MDKNLFITELIEKLSYSYNEKDLKIIIREVNSALLNYEIKKIDSFSIVLADDFNNILLKKYELKKQMAGLKQGSINQTLNATRNMLVALNKRCTDVTTQDVEQYLMSYKYTRDVSNSTLNNMKAWINNFYLFLFDEEIITRNPVAKVTKIKKDTIHDLPISKTEEEKLYANCKDLRDKAIIETLFATGCRVSELVGIKIKDIDFFKHEIYVIGKGNKSRTVPISEKALFHIQEYLNNRPAQSEYLFISKRRPFNNISVDAVQSTLKNIAKKAMVDNIHPHRFRATTCTRLLDSGMDIQKVSHILGHSNIETTMIYYRGDFDCMTDYKRITSV